MKKKNNFWKTLLTMGILFILIVPLGVVVAMSNGVSVKGISNPLNGFYMRQGNSYILGNQTYTLIQGHSYVFEVFDTFSESEDFIVTITPNVTEQTEFEFFVNGETKKFSEMESLMKGFVVSVSGNSFVLEPRDVDMYELIQSYYSESTFSGTIPTAFGSGIPYFKLLVSNTDTTKSIELALKINLDPDLVIEVPEENSTNKGNIEDLPETGAGDLSRYN